MPTWWCNEYIKRRETPKTLALYTPEPRTRGSKSLKSPKIGALLNSNRTIRLMIYIYIYIYIYILHYRKDPKLWELLIVYFTLITLNPKLSTVNPQLFETNQGIDSAKPLSQDSAPPPPQKIEVREGFFLRAFCRLPKS